MNRKQLLARVFVETGPWHSPTGWFCEQCGVECGASEDSLCPCCTDALTELSVASVAGGDV